MSFKNQTPGYETEVVARCFLACVDMEWRPTVAWLQWESNAERTVVAVAVDMKFRKLLKQIAQVDGMQPARVLGGDMYDTDGKTRLTRLRHFMNAERYGIMVHKDVPTKRVTVMFTNRLYGF